MTPTVLAVSTAEGSRLSLPKMLPAGKGISYIRAADGQRFIISDSQNLGQPSQLLAKRHGKHLLLSLPGEDEPRLVIYDFYENDARLQGIGDDGRAHDWITVDGNGDVDDIADDGQAFVQLSESHDNAAPLFVPVHDSGAWQAFTAFAALLGLGGIIRAMQNQHSGSSESPPPAPPIDYATDDTGIYTGTLRNGGLTDDATPALSGSGARPGDLITVYADGQPVGSVIADDSGSWTLMPESPLGHGLHTFTATATSPSGLVSSHSGGFMLDVDLIAPARPQVVKMDDDTGTITGELASGGVTDDARPLFTGCAEPGASILFMLDGTPVGSAIVDADGNWSWQPVSILPDGAYSFTAQATDPAGNIGLPSLPFTFIVDTVILQPLIDTVTDAIAGGVNGPIPNDGAGLTNDNRPLLAGSAEAGSLVTLYDGQNTIGSVMADSNGNWSWQYPAGQQFTEGVHALTVNAIDKAGNSSTSESFIITVDSRIDIPLIHAVTDQVAGGVNGPIPNDGTGLTNDNRPLLTGSAEAGSLVTLYDGRNTIGSVMADSNGNWSWQYPAGQQFTEGTHNLNVVATDSAGNTSSTSATFTITVDTFPPAVSTAVVTSSNPAAVWDSVNNVTNDQRPALSGNEGEKVTVLIEYKGTLYSVISTSSGIWSWQPDFDLDEGDNRFSVSLRDEAGNENAASIIGFTVDTTAPVASAIVTQMTKDSGANSGDLITNDGTGGRLILGTLTAALGAREKVQISFDNGNHWIDVTVNPDNSWQVVDLLNHNASWDILTRVIDSVGNATSATQKIILDTQVEAPTSVSWNGDNLSVDFTAADLRLGDKLLVTVDNVKFYHILSQAEVDAGVATVPWPAASQGNPKTVTVAHIDQVNNISSSAVMSRLPTTTLVEDFEKQTARTFVNGEKVVLSNFTLEVINRGTAYLSGFSRNQNWTDPSPTMAMNIGAGSKVLMQLATQDNNFIAMTIGDLNQNEIFTATFYDQNTHEVHRVQLTPTSAGLRSDINYELPFGLTFSSVTLELTAGGLWIDNVVLGRFDYAQSPDLQNPAQNQTIVKEDVSWFGDALDNIFTLADVAMLEGAESGIHANGGLDTLKLTGAGQTLDLSILGNKITSVEIFDITGSGNNTLNLAIGDVLSQGETGLFIDNEKVQMMIKGNAGDKVNLSDILPNGTDVGDWNIGDNITIDGLSYSIYEHSGLETALLIQQDITVNINNH